MQEKISIWETFVYRLEPGAGNGALQVSAVVESSLRSAPIVSLLYHNAEDIHLLCDSVHKMANGILTT